MSSYYESIKDERAEWVARQLRRCMYCGIPESMAAGGLQVHEIERRSQAPNNWAHESNYLLLCQVCHDGPFANYPHAWQLACKLIRDPECFDLDNWLRLRDRELRAPERVTLADIVRHLEMPPH